MIVRKIVRLLQTFFDALASRFRYDASAFLRAVCPPLWRRFFSPFYRRGRLLASLCDAPTRPTPNPKDVLGRDGERFAFDYFRADANYTVLARNLETYFCELDLILIDKKARELVFVEVKTRRRENATYPTINAVDAKRRKKIALAGKMFARDFGASPNRLRFDVVVIIWPQGGAPRLTHYRAHFQYETAVRGYRKYDFGRRLKPDERLERRDKTR